MRYHTFNQRVRGMRGLRADTAPTTAPTASFSTAPLPSSTPPPKAVLTNDAPLAAPQDDSRWKNAGLTSAGELVTLLMLAGYPAAAKSKNDAEEALENFRAQHGLPTGVLNSAD